MTTDPKLFEELRKIITDQIIRHVAMPKGPRAWLADDISSRVCAIADEALRKERADHADTRKKWNEALDTGLKVVADLEAAESALAAKTREMEEMREILSWLEQNDVMFTSGYLIATKETVFTVHEVREEGIDDACGDELGTGPTLREAILAAMKAARSAPPAEK